MIGFLAALLPIPSLEDNLQQICTALDL